MENEYRKHEHITKILGLDLTCPHCKEILVTSDERRKEREQKREVQDK